MALARISTFPLNAVTVCQNHTRRSEEQGHSPNAINKVLETESQQYK